MYGRYSKALGEQLKEEARKIRQLEKQRKEEYRRQRKELRYRRSTGDSTRRSGIGGVQETAQGAQI